MKKARYESGWFRLANQAAKSQASIHDDEKARQLGFRRGFVPGTTISIAVLGSIVEYFGKQWFETGWHDLTFVDPAYDDEDLQIRFEREESGDLRVADITSDHRLTCTGSAGVGPKEFVASPPRVSTVFPSSVVGTRFPEHHFTPTIRDYISSIRAAGAAGGRASEWCHSAEASPWGKVLVPPAGLLPLTRWAQSQLSLDDARLPAMNSRMRIAYRAPVFADEPLCGLTWLASKRATGRTWGRTIGFTVHDESGIERAHGMHTIRWWAPLIRRER